MRSFLDDFWSAVALLESKKEAREFFFDLLTHTERKMLAKRLQITMMLLDGDDYRAIRDNLGVTDVTIAKVNNWLNTDAEGLRKIAKRLIDLKEKKIRRLTQGRRRKVAGDLATPAVKFGLDVATRQLKKWKKRKSI